MLFPCSKILTIQILLKKLKFIFNICQKDGKKKGKFIINGEILSSPCTLMSKTKVLKITKVQMEHFEDLIIDSNIT
jgi:hypothetical protein